MHERSSKRLWLRVVENVLSLAAVVAVGAYIWKRRDEFAALLDVSALDLTLIGAGVVATWVCNAWQSYLMYRAEGKGIGFGESLLLAGAANFGNYLPLRAGTVVRARYMKQVHALSYSRTGSIFGIRAVLMVISTGALGLVGVVGLSLSGGVLSWELLVVCAGLVVSAGIIIALPLPEFATKSGKIQRAWADFRAGFLMVRKRSDISLKITLLMVSQHMIVALRLGVALNMIGMDPPPYTLLVLATLMGLATFIAVVPGGLGLREALMGYVTLATGTEFSSGLFAATLDRAAMLVVTSTWGLFGFVYVLRRTRLEAATSGE